MLIKARNKVINILLKDIQEILKVNRSDVYTLVVVPRAKKLATYSSNQLMFQEAVTYVSTAIPNIKDGTEYLIRTSDTLTTHLEKATIDGRITGNFGDKPYPGITNNTCSIKKREIYGKNIILVDDIYTKNVNIDEDCIQTLFDAGAQNVIFYSIGRTRRDK